MYGSTYEGVPVVLVLLRRPPACTFQKPEWDRRQAELTIGVVSQNHQVPAWPYLLLVRKQEQQTRNSIEVDKQRPRAQPRGDL